MIISQAHKFAFIHNPKVAGTSVRKAIASYHDYPERFWHQGFLEEHNRVVDLAHIPYRDLDARIKTALSKCFVFGFVRHPVLRFWASLAEFRRQHADWNVAKLSADELLNTWLTPANIRYDWRFTHFCPQHYFFYEGNKCKADYIGRHEDFKRSWSNVQKLIGLDLDPLDNNRSRGYLEPEALEPASYAHIQRLYMKDTLLFGYERWDTSCDAIAEDGRPSPQCQPIPNTHEHRVELIHVPYLDASTLADLPLGERVAFLETRVRQYEREFKLRNKHQEAQEIGDKQSSLPDEQVQDI